MRFYGRVPAMDAEEASFYMSVCIKVNLSGKRTVERTVF